MSKYKLTIIVFIFGLLSPFFSVSAFTILSTNKYAWSDNVGWINFAPVNSIVTVSDTALSGSAWSENKGYINFAPAQGGVFNDITGDLSGSAWGESLGYIDFDNVSIDPLTGKFSGTATGALVGTITFDCTFCDVETDWRGIPAPVPPPSSSSSSGSRSSNLTPPVFIPALPILGPVDLQSTVLDIENKNEPESGRPQARAIVSLGEAPEAPSSTPEMLSTHSQLLPDLGITGENISDASLKPEQKVSRSTVVVFSIILIAFALFLWLNRLALWRK